MSVRRLKYYPKENCFRLNNGRFASYKQIYSSSYARRVIKNKRLRVENLFKRKKYIRHIPIGAETAPLTGPEALVFLSGHNKLDIQLKIETNQTSEYLKIYYQSDFSEQEDKKS